MIHPSIILAMMNSHPSGGGPQAENNPSRNDINNGTRSSATSVVEHEQDGVQETTASVPGGT